MPITIIPKFTVIYRALQRLPFLLYLNSSIATTDADKTLLYNEFFHSVYTNNLSTLPDMNTITSELDVYNALINLDLNKALRIDGISPKVLKYCAESLLFLVQPLCHRFNLSLSTSVIPTESWKTHQIIPIFKSVDRSLISDYCPISLLCSVSKVLTIHS